MALQAGKGAVNTITQDKSALKKDELKRREEKVEKTEQENENQNRI